MAATMAPLPVPARSAPPSGAGPALQLAGTRLGALDLSSPPLARAARAGHTSAALPLIRSGRTTVEEVVIASAGADEAQILHQSDGTLLAALPFPPAPSDTQGQSNDSDCSRNSGSAADAHDYSVTAVALSQPEKESSTVLLFASKGNRVCVWRSHPPGSRRTRRWAVHSSLTLPSGTNVTAMDAFQATLVVGTGTGEICMFFLPPPPAHNWIQHPWRVPAPKRSAAKPVATVRLAPDGSYLAAALHSDRRVLVWSLALPRSPASHTLPCEPVLLQRLVLSRTAQRIHWRTPPPAHEPTPVYSHQLRSLAQPVLVVYTSEGTLRFYTPVLDQPNRLSLVAAVDRASFSPDHVANAVSDSTPATETLYFDAGSLALAGNACYQRLQGRLSAMELGMDSNLGATLTTHSHTRQTVSPSERDLVDTLRTRIKRLEYFSIDSPDVLLRVEGHKVVMRALAGVDCAPPSLVQGYTALAMDIPPLSQDPANVPTSAEPSFCNDNPLKSLSTSQASAFIPLVPDTSFSRGKEGPSLATAGFVTLGADGARTAVQMRLDHLFDGHLNKAVCAPPDYTPAAPGSAAPIQALLPLPTGSVACAPIRGGVQATLWTVFFDSTGKPVLAPSQAHTPPIVASKNFTQALRIGEATVLIPASDPTIHMVYSCGAKCQSITLPAAVLSACHLAGPHRAGSYTAALVLSDGSVRVLQEQGDHIGLSPDSEYPPLPSEAYTTESLASCLERSSLQLIFCTLCLSSATNSRPGQPKHTAVLSAWSIPTECKGGTSHWSLLSRCTLPLSTTDKNLDVAQGQASLCFSLGAAKIAFSLSLTDDSMFGIWDPHTQHLENGMEYWALIPSSSHILPSWNGDGDVVSFFSGSAVQILAPDHEGTWSSLAEIDCSTWTAHIGASTWVGNALLVAGGSTLRVYAPNLESDRRKMSALPIPIALANRVGPLAPHHPDFLSAALTTGRVDLAKGALSVLLHALRTASGSSLVEVPALPLRDFWHRTVKPEPSKSSQTAYTALFSNSFPSLDQSDTSVNNTWTQESASELAHLLPTVQLDMSKDEQEGLSILSQAVVDLSTVQASLDSYGLRFLGRLFAVRSPSGKSGTREPLCYREAVVAFHSPAQEPLLTAVNTVCGTSMTWSTAKDIGVFLWTHEGPALRHLTESVARSEFLRPTIGTTKGAPAGPTRDPVGCSLLYFALGAGQEKKMLTLWRQASWHPEQAKMITFLSKDFSVPRWRAAAAKNAYVLMSQRRFLFAASFFMLAGALKDAVNVCLRQLRDLDLAITLCRIAEASDRGTDQDHRSSTPNNAAGPVLTWLLWSRVIPLSVRRQDRWMLQYALTLLKHPLSLQALLASWSDLEQQLSQAMVDAGYKHELFECDWAHNEWLVLPRLSEHIGAPETLASLLAAVPPEQRDQRTQHSFLKFQKRTLERLGLYLPTVKSIRRP